MKTRKMLLVSATFVAFNFQFLNNLEAQVSFSNYSNLFAVGTSPQSVTSADFNGDGKTDLATANYASYGVSVLLGNGLGSFAPAVNFAFSTNPCSIISADFNGDGKLDLATANYTTNNVSVLLGDGTGNFGSAVNFTVGAAPSSIIAADFNGDGKIDLATANYTPNNVSVLLGDGVGSFAPAVNFAVGSNPCSIIAADFNGDGKIDLATANYTTNVSILLGDGAGNFGSAINFVADSGPSSLISADFNGDNKLDLAVANYTSNNVSVLLGDGTGNFGTAINFAVGTNPYSIIAADFDGDGKIDLATANYTSNDVSILLGNGLGSFAPTVNFAVGSHKPLSIITSDFNGDGKLDLAVASVNDNNVSVLLNNSPPPTAPICLVTVDPTNSNHMLVVWEKTSLNLSVIDSFLVYREITTNNYQQIGSISKDSLSVFSDNNANSSTTGYRYKLKTKDTSGVSSNFSDYHNTIYLTNTGGNFSWTPYQIENNSTPVVSYNVYRDDNSTGNFQLIGNTTGNQFGYTDVNFSSFPNSSYYVEAVMVSGTCFPTRSGFGSARSNTKYFGITGVQELSLAKVKVYPNPFTSQTTIAFSQEQKNTCIKIMDMLGKEVKTITFTGKQCTIDKGEMKAGIYFVQIIDGNKNVVNKKIILQ